MKKLTLIIFVGLGTLSLARPRYRFRSPQGNSSHRSSGSLSSVGASNIDDRKPGKVTHLFPSRPSSRPQNSGSLSGVGASNIDNRKPRKADHLFPGRPSSRPQNSGSLSRGGASNVGSPSLHHRNNLSR